MEAEFWHQRWQNNRIGFHQESINPYLQAHWSRLNLAAGSLVFVPLCGKSRDMIWLAEQGYAVTGVEISELAVGAFFEEQGLTPTVTRTPRFQRWQHDGLTILCGDFFDLTADDTGQIQGIYDRAALIAFPADQRRHYARHLTGLLPETLVGLLITLDYPPLEMEGPPFAVTDEELRSLFPVEFKLERVAGRNCLNDSPRFRERGVSRLIETAYALQRG